MQSCLKKQDLLWEHFQDLSSSQNKYEKIIQLGKTLPPFPASQKIPSHLVKGCQSSTYLLATLENGLISFQADSDALISKGLAALLLFIYNDEPIDTLLLCPPTILTRLDLFASLSPTRSNGLKALFQTMQKSALTFLAHTP